MIKRIATTLLAAFALALGGGGCNVPPAVVTQMIADYRDCGAICLADDLVQVELEVWVQWIDGTPTTVDDR